MSKRLDDRSTRHDRFHQKAKKEGFLARAVFKLEELDDQFKLFGRGARVEGSRRSESAPGLRVLDLGCAPGSWLQFVRSRAGERATLVGLDRAPLRGDVAGARIVVGDVMTIDVKELLGDLDAFDVVLSDMAPDTSGIRSMDQARSEALFERAFEIALLTLAPGGHFVGKLFQGPEFKKLVEQVRSKFEQAKTAKPESSRQISIEQYVVGLRRKAEPKTAAKETTP
ncbi:MAG TPA: RlmE family RNA methyltransferase [Kofleriaceae bacterium]|nr:RlmE family RNA methyltransferase [Kofleriaceae bacterium]